MHWERRRVGTMAQDDIVGKQQEHWRQVAQRNAGTVGAVGSESLAHKHLRYAKVSQVFGDEQRFSLHDVGPGVCDYYAYLTQQYPQRAIDYSASEITPEFCSAAAERFPDITVLNRDVLELADVSEQYDFVVLSGVFHQRGDVGHSEWISYMESLVARAFELARMGVAFNVLSPYADFYNPGNYYASLFEVQTFIVRRLSRFFTMDHAYPLFEATFCVYKESYVRTRFPQQGFAKYFSHHGQGG